LVNAIRYLAANPDWPANLGRSGREYIVRKFSSSSKPAENYIRVLESLLHLREDPKTELRSVNNFPSERLRVCRDDAIPVAADIPACIVS